MTHSSAERPAPVLFVHFGEDWVRGSERCLLDLLRHLDRSLYEPFVWCNRETMASAVRAMGIPVTVSRFTILLDWSPPRLDIENFLSLVREGRRLVKAHGIRLIHANSGAPNQWMIPVARMERIPIVAHLHAIYDLRGRCIFGLHHASRVLGVSFETIHGLRDDGVDPRRARVVHNGIDVDRLGAGDATRLRRELAIGDEVVVIVGVGSLIPRKGFHVLIRAFASLHAERPATALLIVGDGPERSRLDALTRELGLERTVHLLGERGDVGAIFRDAADIAVSASFEEAFGLAVMEAAAMGIPLVATRVAGTAEVVEENETGIIVPPNDAGALCAEMRRLVDDPDLRTQFGEAGRALIHEDFTIQRNVSSICAIYETLLARPPKANGWRRGWGPLRPWIRLAAGAVARKLGFSRRAPGSEWTP